MLSACSATADTPVPSPSRAPSSSPLPSSSAVARQVLPPAKSLPVVALCAQALATTSDGITGPLLCASGGLNVLAWQYYAPLAPRTLSAGSAASARAVQSAVCGDWMKKATAQQAKSAYELAAAYYGWSFATDPTLALDSGCA